MNPLTKNSEIAHMIWERYINEDSVAIDMTCGNGNDTLYLAERCRFVYGIDIQEEAIHNTDMLLKKNGFNNYELIQCDHKDIGDYINEKADLIVYNLGYLPKGNKNITTTSDSTIASLESALELININGLVSIMIYWGHPQGKTEREAVLEYVSELDGSVYHVAYLSYPNQKNTPPELVLITRKK